MIKKYSQLNNSFGGYISLKVKKEDAEKIVSAVKACGVKDGIKAEKLHVTVIYDERDPNLPADMDSNWSFKVLPGSLLPLGSGEWEAITLLLKDPTDKLKDFHNSLLRTGFKHSHFTFSPHISLKYQASREDIQKLNNQFLSELGDNFITLERPKQEKLK